MWPVFQQYSQKNLDYAISHVSNFKADRGGTEVLNPIKDVVSQRLVKSNSSTQIIILTNGEEHAR